MQTPQKNQTIKQFAPKTKFLIFVKSGLLHSSSDIAKTFMLLCLKCYVDKEDNLMCYAYLNVYALYALHLSRHQFSVLPKPLLAKLLAEQISACASIPSNQYLPYVSTIPSYSW